MKFFQSIRFTISSAVLTCGLFAQTTWHVAPGVAGTGDGSVNSPFASVQDGIQAAAARGDEVRIAPGTYAERINLLGKAVLVYSSGGLGTVSLTGDGTGSIVTMAAAEGDTTILRGLSISGGSGIPLGGGMSAGGGVYMVDSFARLESCDIAGNSADYGAGFYCEGGGPTLSSCHVQGNFGLTGVGMYGSGTRPQLLQTSFLDNESVGVLGQATGGVGAYLEDCLAGTLIESGFVRGNRSPNGPANGVGLWISGSAEIVDTTFSENRTGDMGLGLPAGGQGIGMFARGTIELAGCRFEYNLRGYEGGAIYSDLDAVTATDCYFRGNGAGFGGAVSGGTYERCTFEENIGGFDGVFWGTGSAAYLATLEHCLLKNNFHDTVSFYETGGAAYNCSLDYCFVTGNRSREVGGLISCTATHCLIQGNEGGGAKDSTIEDCEVLFNEGHGLLQTTATRCRIEGNFGAAFGGGARFSQLTDCELIRNRALEEGGGASASSLTRCVVFGNEAPSGGGVNECSPVFFCSISGNFAGPESAGVVGLASGLSIVRNSIIWDNSPAEVAGTADVTWSNVQGGYPGQGNINANPGFVGPASGDLHLLAGSPSIDAGDPGAPLDPDGSRADQGAFPWDPNDTSSPGIYCEPKPNHLDCVATIGSSGSATLSGSDDFALMGEGLTNNSLALAFVGSRPVSVPAVGGILCVGASQRVGVTNTGGTPGAPTACDGSVAIALNQAFLSGYGVGELVYAQIIYRDPLHPDGTGVALTGGLEFRVLP